MAKYYGSILDFTKQRNTDLLNNLRRVLHSMKYISMPEAFRLVADSPAQRSYVSEERATIVISSLISGRNIPKMRKNRHEMFHEILRRYIILRLKFPHKSMLELISEIVNQPAPKFYLTPRTVGEFIYRIKKKKNVKQ